MSETMLRIPAIEGVRKVAPEVLIALLESQGRPKGVSTKILERQSTAGAMVEWLGGDATWKWAKEQAAKKKDYRTVVEIMSTGPTSGMAKRRKPST